MFIPGHLAAGYLVTTILLAYSREQFSPSTTLGLYCLGLLVTVLIDFDVFAIMLKYRRVNITPKQLDEHRSWTHAFLPHLALCLGAYAVNGFLWGSTIVSFGATVYLFCAASHLLLDSLWTTMGARWFWPFERTAISIIPASAHDRAQFESIAKHRSNIWSMQFDLYRSTTVGKIELFLIAFSIIVAVLLG